MLATIKHAIQRQTSAHGLMKRGQKPVKHEQFIGFFLGGFTARQQQITRAANSMLTFYRTAKVNHCFTSATANWANQQW